MEEEDLAGNIYRTPKSLLYYPDNIHFYLAQQIAVTLNGKEAM